MSVDVEGTYELDGIEEEEEDLRSPLILEESKRSNTSTFFQFPAVSPRRSILKPRKQHDSAKPSVFLTVPVPGGDTAPLPSPIVPTSTPLPVHGLHRVSFYGQQDFLPVEQSVSCPATQFNTTRYKRSQYLSNLLLILTEGLLPLVSIVSTLVNVLELFLIGEQILGWAGLAIFAFPTVLVLFYYLENMFHREKKLLELGLIVIFGPFLRWLCSVRLLSSKLYPGSEATDLDDVRRFAFATKVIDGIFQACIQIIWLLYLIAIEVYPFPLLNMRTRSVTDWFGNNLEIPVFSSLSLYSSLAVLVKNLSQLWRIHYPVSTDQDGSVTLELQPKVEGNCKILFQWFLLVLFTSTGVLYRLISYSLLFLHLNLFMMPAGGIIILSTLLHVILRGVSDKFYVETSKMNVFLTACCCGLVPTPTSSNIRAHNLLQVHNAITNVFLLIAVLFCIFFSIDYSVPIVRRPSRLGYSRDYFFNYCLVAVFLLPISILFYSLFKKTMGYPGLVRKTIFWKNRSPTVVSILTGIVSFLLLVSLAMLNMLGRHASYQCQESTSPVLHGLLLPQATGHGSRLECHQNYRPSPAPVIYCSWFFGHQGVIELEPLYYQELTGAQSVAEKVAFMRNLSTVTCMKTNPTCPAKRDRDRCNTTSLQSTAVPHGSWHCAGENCALFCQPGYLSTGSRTFLCQANNTAPRHYCQLASLAVSNLTHTQTLSLETGDCTSSWEKDTTGHSHDRHEDLVLCRNASDILTCDNSCQSLNITDHHLSFTANSSSRSLVSYSPLPIVNRLVEGGKAVSDSHLSFSWEKECIVKISHDTMLIIGERTLLIKYTGPGAIISYWVLPSLQYPRHHHDCTLLDGGLVLVAGGKGAWRRNWMLETEMMNINMLLPAWKLVGNLAVPRMRGTFLTVSGGCPLLVGGQGEQGVEVLAVEEFHLHTGNENGKWEEVPLEMSFIPELWSVAVCGNNSCTDEKFDAGGPRYNCVEKIPVAAEVKKTTNKPSLGWDLK